MSTDRLPLPLALTDPAFTRCAHEAIETPELVENFNRLYGASVGRGTPLEREIDSVTGKSDDDMRAFINFVHDGIYLRVPDETIEAFRAAASLAPQETR